jgi:hypothetical protein
MTDQYTIFGPYDQPIQRHGDEIMFDGLTDTQVLCVEAWLKCIPEQNWRGGLLRFLKAELLSVGPAPWTNLQVETALLTVWPAHKCDTPILEID